VARVLTWRVGRAVAWQQALTSLMPRAPACPCRTPPGTAWTSSRCRLCRAPATCASCARHSTRPAARVRRAWGPGTSAAAAAAAGSCAFASQQAAMPVQCRRARPADSPFHCPTHPPNHPRHQDHLQNRVVARPHQLRRDPGGQRRHHDRARRSGNGGGRGAAGAGAGVGAGPGAAAAAGWRRQRPAAAACPPCKPLVDGARHLPLFCLLQHTRCPARRSRWLRR
jgi:hypothetical protein